MSAPRAKSQSPDQTKAGLATLLAVFLLALVIVEGLITLSQYWLFAPYPEILGWPAGPLAGVAVVLALGAMQRCRGPGWRAVPAAVLAVTVVTATLIANVVAVTVMLWAIHPPAVSGIAGYAAALFAGLTLTVPVIYGSHKLPERWQAMGLRLRDLLSDEHFRPRSFLGVVLGFAGLGTAAVLKLSLEGWLRAAYPGAGDYPATGSDALCIFSILLFIVVTGPTDRRSAVRSVLGALAVFEVALAGAITGVVAMVTLQANIWLVVHMELLLVILVITGAFILVACRPDGKVGEAVDAGREEEAEA